MAALKLFKNFTTKLRDFLRRKVKASALRVISLLFGSGMKAMTTQCLLLRTSYNIHVYFHEIKRYYIIPCVSIFQNNCRDFFGNFGKGP